MTTIANFINHLNLNYKIEVYEKNDSFIVLVYTRVSTFIDTIPNEYRTLNIDINIPIFIIKDNIQYHVSVDTYNEAIEFLTLKINK